MVDSVSDGTTLETGPPRAGSEDHIALIYETAEERIAAVTPIIKVGLEKGELCLYISNEENDQSIVEALEAEHIDVEKAVSAGGLILTHKGEVYFKTGRFDPEWTLRVIMNVADLARSYGFTAMRVMTDMSWTLENVPGVERWPEYEAKLNSVNPGICVRTICQYDRRAFPAESLLWALRTHPKVVSEGAVYKNDFFVPTERLLQGEHAAVELERIMASIRASSSSEAELHVRESELAELQDRLEQEVLSRQDAELALAQSVRRFDDLAERTSDWAWEVGEDGTYTYASPRVRDILGLPVEDVLGRTPMELVDPEDAERVAAVLLPAMSSLDPITALEKKARHRDGQPVYLEMSGAPVFERDGTFRGYRGIDRDITGRRAAKRAIDEGRQRVAEATAEVAAREERIRTLEAEIEQIRETVNERNLALFALRQKVGQKENERAWTAQERERLQLELSGRQEAMADALSVLEERKAEVTDLCALLERRSAELASAVASSEETKAGLAAQIEERDSHIGRLRNEVRALSSRERDALDREAAATGNVRAAQAADLSAKAAQAAELRSLLKEKEDELAATVALSGKRDSDLGMLRNEVRRLRSREQDLLADLAARRGEGEEVRARLENATAELAAARKELEPLKAAASGAQRELGERGEELSLARTQAQQANAELGGLRERLRAKEAELADAFTRYEGAKAQLATGRERAEDLERSAALLEHANTELLELLREKDSELGRVRNEVRTLRAREDERTAALTSRGLEASMLRQRLGAAEDEVARLTQALSAREGESAAGAALQARVSELEAALARRDEAAGDASGRLNALLGQTSVGIARVDLEGNLLEANGAFLRLVGHGADELVGRSYRECTHRDDLVASGEQYRRALAPDAGPVALRKRYVRKYGDIVWADLSLAAVRDAQGRPCCLMAMASDRTDQMIAEAALVESERKETDAPPLPSSVEAPELASRAVAIAHRLNNALTVITGSVSLAKEYVIPEGRMFGQLEQIERASAEVRELTSHLRAAAQGEGPTAAERPEPAPYRPAELVMGRGKVLLMDGDEGVLEATGGMLRHLGYTAEVARDEAEAAALLRAANDGQPFQALLVDVGSPAARAAVPRLAREVPGLRVVASTGDTADPALADPAAHGFAASLPRPYDTAALSKVLGEVLSRPQ